MTRVVSFCLMAGCSLSLGAQSSTRTLTPDELTSVRSVVGGGTPHWSPDGTSLLIGGALGGSDLWTVPVAGGFPKSLNIRMGGIAFLQAHQQQYSPDGTWISYLTHDGTSSELYLRSLVDGTLRQLTRLGARINSYSWSPDGTRLALAGDKFGNFDIWVVDAHGGEPLRVTRDPRYDVFPSWTPDSRRLLYVRMDDRWLDHDIVVVDASGGGSHTVIASDKNFFDYSAGGTFGYPQVSPDGSQVLFPSHRSGWVNYWVAPISGGAPRQLVAEAANQSGAEWSPDGRSVLYHALWNGKQDLRVVAASGGTPRVLATPGDMGMVSNGEWSPDGNRVSYTLETPTAPSDLFVVPAAGGTAQRITASAGPEYITKALIEPKKISYKSPDGLTISAYLYEPVLAAGQKAPGVLFIHGGPTSSFNDTYQSQVQYLAMQGYAVLLPNIRGSSGYGRTFEDANNGCWGRCDLIDVTAGVEYLRTLPFVDGERMGITGTSYGGCMSMSAAAFAPGVFQAAVAVSGYGDWIHMIGEQELRHLKLVDYEFGPLATNEAVYRASSPFFSIADIQTPMMLLHGNGIPLPRSDASRLFAERLEMNYKPFVYKTYPNENYYIRGRENVIQMFGDIVAYFDQHLKRRSTQATEAAPVGRR